MAVMFLTMRESYAPTILERKAERLRKEMGNVQLRSKLDTGLSTKELFRRCIVRPMKLLIFSPICTIFAVYLMLVYGYLYLLFTSVTFVFQQSYHFSTSTVGLVYLGLGIGCFVGMALFAWDSGRELKKGKSEGAQGAVTPEARLKLLPAGAIVFPIGFFIYGWTADYETHWIAPILGLCVIGIGMSNISVH
jgi:MFS family permease